MMTKRQAAAYQKKMDKGTLKAVATGEKLAKQVSSLIGKGKPVDSIFTPLMLEPIISSLDHAYDELGQSNFEWVIDLYIGRKVAKIIPLLHKLADKLNEQGNKGKENKAEGGGPDHYLWLELYSKDYISMRWDTQSLNYYIDLRKKYNSWVLYVAEYKWNEERQKAEHSWGKEPGYVLEYETFVPFGELPRNQIDDHAVENAWINLQKISRFLTLVNPFCTAMDIEIYTKEQIENGKVSIIPE